MHTPALVIGIVAQSGASTLTELCREPHLEVGRSRRSGELQRRVPLHLDARRLDPGGLCLQRAVRCEFRTSQHVQRCSTRYGAQVKSLDGTLALPRVNFRYGADGPWNCRPESHAPNTPLPPPAYTVARRVAVGHTSCADVSSGHWPHARYT